MYKYQIRFTPKIFLFTFLIFNAIIIPNICSYQECELCMDKNINIPIQMIACCSTNGEIPPLRFRYESQDHELITVNISSVLGHKNTEIAGLKEIQYTCTADINNMTKIFILKYSISTHKWKILKILS